MTKIIIILTIFCSLFINPSATLQAKKKKEKKSKKEVVSKESQARSEKLFIEGMSYFLIGEYSKAIGRFRSADAISPNNAGIHFKLGDAYFKEGVKSQSILHLNKAIELESENKAYYFLLADVYKSEYRFDEAANTYEEMLKNVTGTDQFYLDLAKLYYYLGLNNKSDAKKEEEYLYKALDAYENAEKYYGVESEIVNDKQQIYLKLNKIDKAIIEGEKLLEKYPNDMLNWVRLADMKYKNGDKEGGIMYLEKAIEVAPEQSGMVHLQLFEYYSKDQKTGEAFNHLEKAFELNSLGLELKVKLLEQYFYKKMSDKEYQEEALVLSTKLVELYHDEAIAHAVNGDILYLSDNKESARDAYVNSLSLDNSKYIVWEQVVRLETDLQQGDSIVKHSEDAIEIFPNQPNLWLYKGIGHMLLKDDEKAVLAFEHGKKITLGNRELEGFFNAQLGDTYNNLEEYEKADKSYDEALLLNPDNAHVLNNYSYYLSLRKEKLSKALVMSEKLIKEHPDELTYLDTHAWVLYQLKDYNQAEKYLKKAVEGSDNGTILEHYGDVLFRLGKKNEAVEYWRKAKEHGETTDLIDKKITDEQLYEE